MNKMSRFSEVDKKYFEKFGTHIGIPINGFTENETIEKMLDECEKCIERNEEFDGEKFFGKTDENDVI